MDIAKIIELVEKNLYEEKKFEIEIRNNLIGILSTVQNDEFIKVAKLSVLKCAAILRIFNYYLPLLNQTDGDVCNALRICWKVYFNELTLKNYPIIAEKFLHNLFHNFAIKIQDLDLEMVEFYTKVDLLYDKRDFSPAKAILCYYAYKTRNYKIAELVLNEFAIILQSEQYNQHYDFCMMNYYKGIIFLSQENFNSAALCFILCMSSKSQMSIQDYTYHQLEALRRLVLLINLVSSDIKKDLLNTLNLHDVSLLIKPNEHYLMMKVISTNPKSTYDDFLKIENDYAAGFHTDKTFVSN